MLHRMTHEALLGTPQHRAVLEAIIRHYADDARIRAIILFGSLSAGNWHPLSDLDLDIVVEDGILINPVQELQALCRSLSDLGGDGALIIPDGEEEGDVVLTSLMEFSVRYHPLATTSPNIVDQMHLLAGRIDLETVRAVGLANRVASDSSPTILISQCIRWAIEIEAAIERNRLWLAVELLHYIRANFMEIFTQARQGVRPLRFFEIEAPESLHVLLGKTLPSLNHAAIFKALVAVIGILHDDLEKLGDASLTLTNDQRRILAQLQVRMENAHLGS